MQQPKDLSRYCVASVLIWTRVKALRSQVSQAAVKAPCCVSNLSEAMGYEVVGLMLSMIKNTRPDLIKRQIPYWEGPVSLTGSQKGSGYVEMTGYE